MLLQLLAASPAIALAWIAALLISLTVHEFSHALVAKWRGDRTGEREGRLTLNPLAHLDPLGLIPLVLFGFGWAKPVPFNPYNLKNPKWDSVAVALAGPASNFVLAAIAALVLHALIGSQIITSVNLLTVFLFLAILINLFLLFFNVVPIHPLDGSKLFFALFDHPRYQRLREFVAFRGPQILITLVLISFLTPFDPFFFVTGPAYATCDLLLQGSCRQFLALIFAGL
jgi:Zn-dependent protease